MKGKCIMRSGVFGLALLLALAVAAGAQQQDLKWHKDLRSDVDEATRLAGTDPVSAALIYTDVLEGGKKPTAEQRAWLTQQIASLEPRAVEILQADYDRAAKATDLRGMMLAAAAAERIGAKSVRREPPFDEIKKKVLEGAGGGALWSISEVSATYSKGYSESGGMNFSVIVPKGAHVLRVKARVENANASTDPEYVLYVMGPLKRILGKLSATTEAHRWIDQNFVFVSAGEAGWVGASAIARGSDLATIQVNAGNRLTYPPKALKKGQSLVLDAVFVVPLEAKALKLVVLGATPIELSPAAPEK